MEPAKFRETVMKASRDDVTGHMDVQKHIQSDLASFFLAPVEKGCICFHKDLPADG